MTMKIMTSYSVKIKEYRTIFKETINIYRKCVDYLIIVCLNEWEDVSQINISKFQMNFVEHLIHKTLKSCSATDRLHIEAKVPQCSKRSTCTLSTLIKLNAVLSA